MTSYICTVSYLTLVIFVGSIPLLSWVSQVNLQVRLHPWESWRSGCYLSIPCLIFWTCCSVYAHKMLQNTRPELQFLSLHLLFHIKIRTLSWDQSGFAWGVPGMLAFLRVQLYSEVKKINELKKLYRQYLFHNHCSSISDQLQPFYGTASS